MRGIAVPSKVVIKAVNKFYESKRFSLNALPSHVISP
jgi:hypothetical protein